MTSLVDINNSFESYQQLINLYEEHKEKLYGRIHIGLYKWFAANMSAAMGAVLDLFTENFSEICFDYIKPETERILLKNDFLTYYGKVREVDVNHTTIRFQKLKPSDGKYFKTYVIEELVGRTELPQMSTALKEKIVEAIYEIFVNAQIHSETKHIYTCGQFYPTKNKIEFTIVDTGIGFRNKINNRFSSSLSATQAIQWAVKDKNTTKETISGGIGLALLKEFIDLNKGKMQIVSDAGYYEFGDRGVVTESFAGRFPGTIVNLQFCTDDTHKYALKSEININDIF
ncbi:MAG: ATP-binding protein [Tannerella sp.]|jgi:anti-sigma regulatory factor (Ser/Thr protein kinase)|nr:ATP-binding protein [Tannerella sp.]